MVYLGSKAQIANWLIPILNSIIQKYGITNYYEPFVGGANVIDKIKCEHRIGNDKNKPLIALLEVARDNFEAIPKDGNKEWFDRARAIYTGKSNEEMDDYLIGAIGWLAGYSGKGLVGSYANDSGTRHYYTERYNNLKAQAPNLQGIEFICADYQKLEIPDDSLIYCDPPYQGTTGYGYAWERAFDYDIYWNWVRDKSKSCYVVCSEEQFPEDFIVVAKQDKKRTVAQTKRQIKIEKLGVYKDGLLGNLKL